MKRSTLKQRIRGAVSRPAWLGALAAGLLAPFLVWSVVDVDTDAIFELDGNAITTSTGDDWDQIASGIDVAADPSTFLVDVYPPASGDNIFTGGGSKDERDISGNGTVWQNTTGGPPDKNNLEHAFAGAYRSAATDFDLHIYFGADRFDNSGDSAIGFWFFQDNVADDGNGGFTGKHKVGDILVTSDFRNGGGVSVINVYKWIGGRNPLQLLIAGAPAAPGSGSEPFCLQQNGMSVACGIANRDNAPVPGTWPGGYAFKGGGNDGQFPVSTLYEGGINITQLLGPAQTCFSSFMAMTRTSASTTAQLKDYVVGQFPLCGIEVAKSCDGATTVSESGDLFHNEYTITITNTGIGPVHDAAFIETSAKLEDADAYACQLIEVDGNPVTPIALERDVPVVVSESLASDAAVTATVACDTIENPFDNKASAIAYADEAHALEVTAAEVGSDPGCPAFQVEGALLIDKQCAQRTDVNDQPIPPVTLDGDLKPTVCVDITVTNDRTEIVKDIQIDDDQLPGDAEPAPFTLAPKGQAGDSMTFEDLCYRPLVGDDPAETNPGKVTFTDNAQATGTGVLSKSTLQSAIVTATCDLCPCVDCE